MIFQEFHDYNKGFNDNMSVGLIQSFYADCLLHHELEELAASHSEPIECTNDMKKWLDNAFCYLFSHYPVCNLTPLNGQDTLKQRKAFDSDDIDMCIDWFHLIFSINSRLCKELFPIVVFIIGDSCGELKEKSKSIPEDEFANYLYQFITDNIFGKYQDQYLFSLLSGHSTQKHSCIINGSDVLEELIKKRDKLQKNNDWIFPSECMKPAVIHLKAPDYVNEIDQFVCQFFSLAQPFRKKLQKYYENRNKAYKSNATIKSALTDTNYFGNPNLLGENFIALTLFLQDFHVDTALGKISWCNYNHALSTYALSQMTQWIIPFTTRTIRYIMPAYNPYCPLTCLFLNEYATSSCLSINDPRWELKDFSEILEKYKIPCIYPNTENLSPVTNNYITMFYECFKESHREASEEEQSSFHNFVKSSYEEIYQAFMQCRPEYISLPTNTELRSENFPSDSLGYFYCLADRFTYML